MSIAIGTHGALYVMVGLRLLSSSSKSVVIRRLFKVPEDGVPAPPQDGDRDGEGDAASDAAKGECVRVRSTRRSTSAERHLLSHMLRCLGAAHLLHGSLALYHSATAPYETIGHVAPFYLSWHAILLLVEAARFREGVLLGNKLSPYIHLCFTGALGYGVYSTWLNNESLPPLFP